MRMKQGRVEPILVQGRRESHCKDRYFQNVPFPQLGDLCECTWELLSSEGHVDREDTLALQRTAWQGESLTLKTLACVSFIVRKPEFHLCRFWWRKRNRELGFFLTYSSDFTLSQGMLMEWRWGKSNGKGIMQKKTPNLKSLEINYAVLIHHSHIKGVIQMLAISLVECIPSSNTPYVLLYMFTLWTPSWAGYMNPRKMQSALILPYYIFCVSADCSRHLLNTSNRPTVIELTYPLEG